MTPSIANGDAEAEHTAAELQSMLQSYKQLEEEINEAKLRVR